MPWSVPTLALSSASNTSLAKVRISPALSPAAPVSVTASVDFYFLGLRDRVLACRNETGGGD
jgi:hypothetical protein